VRPAVRACHRLAAILTVASVAVVALPAAALAATPPTIGSLSVSAVTSTTAVLSAEVDPEGAQTKYRFEYGTGPCPAPSCTKVPAPEGTLPAGTAPVPVEALLEGLRPQTIYHFRLVAKNPAVSESADRTLATYGPTVEGLPDGRAYEQASPVDKDGGDAEGYAPLVKSTPDGDGILFSSTFGVPGGRSASSQPSFLAGRTSSGWSSTGLMPPQAFGPQNTQLLGHSPDYSRVYSRVVRFGDPLSEEALVEQSPPGGPVTVIAPYAEGAEDSLAGESPDGSVVFFEAKVKLPPTEGGTPIAAATEGHSNLYAWDRATGEVHLAGVFDQGAPKGSFAGPYDWSLGENAVNLDRGGGERNYYLSTMHAVTPSGDVFFTAAGTGLLYERLDPTQPQSAVVHAGEPDEECTEPAKACTIEVSASQKTNGDGQGGADAAGPAPAAFQAATEDGSQVFFTSSEKLTDDANTGPEQPLPSIGRAKIGATEAEDPEGEFLKEHRAVGVARHGPWLYWADPSAGTIGRVRLDAQEEIEPATEEPAFIAPPPSEGECEAEDTEPGSAPDIFTPVPGAIPSEPRYLAIDEGHVYWTNSGLRNEVGQPRDGGGTIGRAALDGGEGLVPGSVEPAFICGEQAGQPGKRLVSNPQGIAVDAGHVYWANAAQLEANGGFRTIARAAIDGGGAKEEFIRTSGETPYGVALGGGYLYYVSNDVGNEASFVTRTNLEGGEGKLLFIGEVGPRGLALDSGHVYWTTQGEGDEIGRADLELSVASREKTYLDLEGSPTGLAAGASHLFWAVNGEGGRNPGNDLYRYEPATGTLADLTPLAGGEGAAVQGVLGVSADGSYVYFAANGVLAPGAVQGDCKGPVKEPSGRCDLYAWHEGQVSLVAPLDEDTGLPGTSDALDWVGTPLSVATPSGYEPRSSFLADGGRVLVFRSQEQLTAYENTPADAACGVQGGSPAPCPEYYRHDIEEPGRVTCLTCRPTGEPPGREPGLGAVTVPELNLLGAPASYPSRNLSASGGRFFFETTDAEAPADVDGTLDVYEWEEPGLGSCSASSPSYSPLDEGCLSLVSTGKSPDPSYLGDADEEGQNVFFFTRQGLVGQDTDSLQDVYDARVGGGLPSQSPTPPNLCEGAEACHGAAGQPPAEGNAATPGFTGPGNAVQKPKKKHRKHGHHRKKAKHPKKHHHTRHANKRSRR
jgi:hypothetical protein